MLEADTPPLLLADLPADLVQHILVRLTLAHDIARTAPTCKVVSVAARNAFKVRPFSGEVVTLADAHCVATAPDGDAFCVADRTVQMWRGGACERTIQAHTSEWPNEVAALPGGAGFVGVKPRDGTATLWALDGALERIFAVGKMVTCVAALPDGVHFVVGRGGFGDPGEVRLYHVDGTLVHTFKGHMGSLCAVAVTRDGKHIISGSTDYRLKVWSVAAKTLVSTCRLASFVLALAAMPDGQRILSGGGYGDTTVRVWLLDGTLENTFSELHAYSEMRPNSHVCALAALPDNQHALSGSGDTTVKLFNVNNGVVLRTFKHHTDDVCCLALLPDGLRFISAANYETRIVYHGLAPAP